MDERSKQLIAKLREYFARHLPFHQFLPVIETYGIVSCRTMVCAVYLIDLSLEGLIPVYTRMCNGTPFFYNGDVAEEFISSDVIGSLGYLVTAFRWSTNKN